MGATCNVPAPGEREDGRVALRVVIVDDNELFLASARAVLESPDLHVVGTATTPEAAVTQVAQARPDVVVTDLHLGSVSGLELARLLAEGEDPAPAVVLVSTVGSDDLAALAAGTTVRGVLTKTDLSAAAVEAIVRGPASRP
jgi:DNA-binding NarL/FixJ family response regulator